MDKELRMKGVLSLELKDGLYVFVNYKGEQIYPYEYEICEYLFTESYIKKHYYLVKEAGLFGVICVHEEKIDVIVPCKYLKIKKITSFLFVVQDKNHLYGICNNIGELTLPCEYDLINDFFDRNDEIYRVRKVGLCRVKKNDKWGFVNRKGIEAVPCQYDSIEIKRDSYIVHKERLKGIISFDGDIITPCQYDTINNYYLYALWKVTKDGLEGLLNDKGIEVFPCIYDKITRIDFTDLFVVSKGGLVGVLNIGGTEVIPCKYDKIKEPEHGKCIAVMDGQFGLMDLKGSVIIPCQYDELHSFRGVEPFEKLYLIKKDGLYGILNENNKLLVPCLYKFISLWYGNSRFQVIGYKGCRDGKYYYIDKNGKEFKEISEDEFNNEEFEEDYDNWELERPSYGRYAGTWAQDHEGYSDDDIDTIFDGEPDAYWNID